MKDMRKLSVEQRFQVVAYSDRMFYAAVAEGLGEKEAERVARVAAERKALELSRRSK